jgi:hypothetical protein
VYCANAELLVLYSHVEKTPQFFSKFIAGAPFAKNARANCSKNASSLTDRALKNKNEIITHPTDHGNAHFEPILPPTNNPAALV